MAKLTPEQMAEALRAEAQAEAEELAKGGGNLKTSYLKKGNTFLYLISEGDPNSAPKLNEARQHVTDIFKGSSTTKVMIRAIVVKTDDASGLDDEWQNRIVTLVLAKTAWGGINSILVDEYAPELPALTYLSAPDENGNVTIEKLGTCFRVTNAKVNDTTKYSASLVIKAKAIAPNEEYLSAETSLAERANDYTEWQLNKDGERAPSEDTTPSALDI